MENSSASDNGEQKQQMDVQMKILSKLQVNARLDVMEDKVATGDKKKRKHGTELSKFSKVNKKDSKKGHVKSLASYNTESSDEDSELPLLADMRTSKAIQRQADRAVASLDRDQKVNAEQGKIKSKRGSLLMYWFHVGYFGRTNIFWGVLKTTHKLSPVKHGTVCPGIFKKCLR